MEPASNWGSAFNDSLSCWSTTISIEFSCGCCSVDCTWFSIRLLAEKFLSLSMQDNWVSSKLSVTIWFFFCQSLNTRKWYLNENFSINCHIILITMLRRRIWIKLNLTNNEPEDVDDNEACGQDNQATRLPLVWVFVEFKGEHHAVPSAQERQRGQYEKAQQIVEDILAVLGGDGPEQPLAKRARLPLDIKLKIADLAVILVALRKPLLQAALVH